VTLPSEVRGLLLEESLRRKGPVQGLAHRGNRPGSNRGLSGAKTVKPPAPGDWKSSADVLTGQTPLLTADASAHIARCPGGGGGKTHPPSPYTAQ
jgi:hypothetical protein